MPIEKIRTDACLPSLIRCTSLMKIDDPCWAFIEGIKIKPCATLFKITRLALIIRFDFCNVSPRQCNDCAGGWVIYSAVSPIFSSKNRKKVPLRLIRKWNNVCFVCMLAGSSIYLHGIRSQGPSMA